MKIDRSILRQYEKKQDEIEVLKIKNLNKKYLDFPKLEEIDQKIFHISHKIAKIYLIEEDKEKIQEEIEKLNKELGILKEERKKFIKLNKVDEEKYNILYDCNECKDTGYINRKGKKSPCNCLKNKVINQNIINSEFNILETNGFTDFNLDYYDKNVDKEKYGSDISPHDNALKILNYLKMYVEKGLNKNIILRGKPGVGKTFILKLFAKELINTEKSVFFESSHNMLDQLIIYKMSNDLSAKEYLTYLEKIKNVDFLFIDDLGTEKLSASKYSELLSIINYRMDFKKATIISTNLINNFQEIYDDRLASRFAGEFLKMTLFGEDNRLKKKE